jgi:hypothetical protein
MGQGSYDHNDFEYVEHFLEGDSDRVILTKGNLGTGTAVLAVTYEENHFRSKEIDAHGNIEYTATLPDGEGGPRNYTIIDRVSIDSMQDVELALKRGRKEKAERELEKLKYISSDKGSESVESRESNTSSIKARKRSERRF